MWNNTKYHARLDKGMCGLCGKVPPRPGFNSCEACSKRRNERDRNLRHERNANGLCAECGKQPLYNANYCRDCAVRVAERQQKHRDKLRAEGCA